MGLAWATETSPAQPCPVRTAADFLSRFRYKGHLAERPNRG